MSESSHRNYSIEVDGNVLRRVEHGSVVTTIDFGDADVDDRTIGLGIAALSNEAKAVCAEYVTLRVVKTR